MSSWLMVTGDFVSHGGMDRANLELAKYLGQRASVDLVTHRCEAALAESEMIRVHQCVRPMNANVLGELVLKRKAMSIAKRLGTQVRSISNGGCAPLTDVNWVHYVHAAYCPSSPGYGLRAIKNNVHYRRCLRWERQALLCAQIVVCNSWLTARHVQEHIGVSDSKIRVVYYGADTGTFKPVTTEEQNSLRLSLNWGTQPSAIFIGALGDRRKGFDLLYDAWRSLCQRPDWDVCLRVVGRGADLAQWKRRAKQDGLGERIEFLGFRTDVNRLLSASDLLVHPARYEAYGLGVHEAICSGVPTIVSAFSGVAERYPENCRDLQLHDLTSHAPLCEKLLGWRRDMENWRSRFVPFSESMRCRTWQTMAEDFVEAVSYR